MKKSKAKLKTVFVVYAGEKSVFVTLRRNESRFIREMEEMGYELEDYSRYEINGTDVEITPVQHEFEFQIT